MFNVIFYDINMLFNFERLTSTDN